MLEFWQSATDPINLPTVVALALLFATIFVTDLRRSRALLFSAALLACLQYAVLTPSLTGLLPALAFAIASAVYLMVMIQRSRQGTMMADERELFEQVMRIEDPDQQRRMRDLLSWQTIPAGSVLMRQGDAAPPLVYVASGSALIEHNGDEVGMCGPGDFVGEMSIVSGQRASATVTATDELHCARFDRDALAQVVRDIPDLGKAIDGALNRSLAAKVLRMNQAATSGG